MQVQCEFAFMSCSPLNSKEMCFLISKLKQDGSVDSHLRCSSGMGQEGACDLFDDTQTMHAIITS